MTQHETLFDIEQAAWRCEIRIKAGGGPFDPAGYSIQVLSPSGALVAMEVHKADSREGAIAHLEELALKAVDRMGNLLAAEHHRELKQRLDHRGA